MTTASSPPTTHGAIDTQPDAMGALTPRALLNATVMLVDDDPLMTEVVQGHLEDAGYRNFVSTNDPTEALALMTEREPSVVLLDLMMPRVSGFDILQAARADERLRFLPIIVLTAERGSEAKLRALQLGATDILAKPVDESELLLRVRNTLAFRRYHERAVNVDDVTELPSRKAFEQILAGCIAQASHAGEAATLFNITVPEMRQVRETFGSAAADRMAMTVAARLQEVARMSEQGKSALPPAQRAPRLARLRFEEFGLVVPGLAEVDAAEYVARRIWRTLNIPLPVNGVEIVPAAQVGIASSASDGQSAEMLLTSAEQARTQARGRAGMQYAFFSAETNQRLSVRMALATQLRHAMERDELELHYQPKVDMHTGQIGGVEALVRWRHPDKGMLQPSEFLDLAEDLGVAVNLGAWALRRACADAAAWASRSADAPHVAVNLSAGQFNSAGLVRSVAQALRETRLAAPSLSLEITEAMLQPDYDAGIARLHELAALGVRISVDHFGTGHTSLRHFKHLPANELKVDRALVAELGETAAEQALARTILSLGRNLGMQVVADGVETPEQLLQITDMGFDAFQGAVFSGPLPAAELVKLLGLPG